MERQTRASRALVLSALVFLALWASGWMSSAPSAGAAQVTPGTAGPTAAATAATGAATATSPAVASPAAASPTLGATATSAAGSPTIAATTAAAATSTATTGAVAAATATATTAAATVAATGTATTAAATVAATGTATTAAATMTLAPTSTPPPTPTIPLATSTAVMIVTPVAAAAPPAAAQADAYMTSVAPQLQYYNGPNAQYPTEWYLQRHLSNPGQFTMYRTEPLGLCNTYYYQFQGVYYCYTAGVAAAVPDYVAPGMGIVPPSVLAPGGAPPGMAVGVVPGMVGGVVQTGTGYAVQSAWANVGPQQQYYYGPNYQYEDDWYQHRHLSNPSLYRVYSYEPAGQCASYYYRWQDRFFCYTGGSVSAQAPAFLAPPPPGVAVDPFQSYAYQSYWGSVDPSNWYYYGADYGYDDAWYAQRHLANPQLYRSYGFDPGPDCGTYSYRYQDQYYCYTGVYDYATDNASWSVPIRYWGQVAPQQRYYYGPDYSYDDAWYAQRHFANPSLFQPFDFEPQGQCGTYYYRYQSTYYCYTGD